MARASAGQVCSRRDWLPGVCCATGIYTGAIYADLGLQKAGLLGEGVVGPEVLAVKAHLHMATRLYNLEGRGKYFPFTKTLFIVRNPFDAIVAERKRFVGVMVKGDARYHAVDLSETQTSSPAWEHFLSYQNSTWGDWVEDETHQWVRERAPRPCQ